VLSRNALMSLSVLFSLCLLITTTMARAAANPEETAAAFVQGLGERAAKEVTNANASATEREARLRRLIETSIDLPVVGRSVLGRYWEETDAGQREEFLTLYLTYLARTYLKNLVDLAPETLHIVGTRQEGAVISVLSELIDDGQPIQIDWRVTMEAVGPRILDAISEGVSFVVTQRAEFASVIRRGGGKVDALLRALREKATARP
jgi:phospholipid transport system substrate-binding protein